MISIVLPAHNEEQAIGRTIEKIRGAPSLVGAEIIVVDDGSTDRTAEIAAAAGARIIRHAQNAGYGRSVKDGIRAATYDVVAIADADGTYPVGQIPTLVARFEEGFDMVVGARTGSNYQEPGLKGLMRRILTFLVEFTAGSRVPDVNSGLRVFSRATSMSYFGHLCDTFSFTTSLTLAYLMTGRFVDYVPIGYDARIGVTKVRLFRDALRTLQYMVQSIVYYNPVKMFLLLAAGCLTVAILAAGVAVVTGSATAALLAGMAVLAALLVFGLGLVADLLRQIMAK
jgi:glycosyltransferase involved in cell wall biosynthesis